MQDMHTDALAHIAFKGMHANTHFSATMLLLNGRWVKDAVQGTVSMGGSSFCTIVRGG